jgi:DNA-binding CsgD family transcriptional regulator
MKKQIYFTPGELRVLKLISKGFQRKKIADKLKRSIHTVDGYIRRLHKITKTHLYSELVAWAILYFYK